MKKILLYGVILMGLMCSFYSAPVQAQFLKKIINSVKQASPGNTDNKTDQPGNAANSSNAAIDTTGTNRVLGAFAKAAEQNPNDTSAADVTMKALGLLISGGGVSAADSAAAIKSFMTGSGGSGLFYQYLTTASSKQMGTTKDTTSMYLTNSGYGRSEMKINMPGAVSNKMIGLSHAGQPKYNVMLYPESKTYSLSIIDTSLVNSGRETYQVTKIGNEIIQGYNCIHSKIVSATNTRFLKSATTVDVWTSTNVPGYSVFEKLAAIQNVQPKMMRALEQAGCGGFFVKMSSAAKDYSMEMLLVKAGKENFPSSLFEIPAGYSESKQNMMYHMATKK